MALQKNDLMKIADLSARLRDMIWSNSFGGESQVRIVERQLHFSFMLCRYVPRLHAYILPVGPTERFVRDLHLIVYVDSIRLFTS